MSVESEPITLEQSNCAFAEVQTNKRMVTNRMLELSFEIGDVRFTDVLRLLGSPVEGFIEDWVYTEKVSSHPRFDKPSFGWAGCPEGRNVGL